MMGGMKLSITSGEHYPHLFIDEPRTDYDRGRAYDVPDGLGAAVLVAQTHLHEAEQAVLRHLLDSGQVARTAEIIEEHLYED